MVVVRKQTSKELDASREASESLHDQLCDRAEKWLKGLNCKVTFNYRFRAHTRNGEYPDAIGWRDGLSILVEAKASRADFLADKRKKFRMETGAGMGDWRFYLCPEGVVTIDDLPLGWGLLYAKGKRIYNIHGVPPNTRWHEDKPFVGCKESENMLLVSALRRLSIRGYLPEIYKGPPGNEYEKE